MTTQSNPNSILFEIRLKSDCELIGACACLRVAYKQMMGHEYFHRFRNRREAARSHRHGPHRRAFFSLIRHSTTLPNSWRKTFLSLASPAFKIIKLIQVSNFLLVYITFLYCMSYDLSQRCRCDLAANRV